LLLESVGEGIFGVDLDGKVAFIPAAKTAPVHNAAGEVTGGVEMFRDVSSMLVDLERAEQIQSRALELNLQYIFIY